MIRGCGVWKRKVFIPNLEKKLTSEKLHHIASLAYSSKKKVSKTSFSEIIRKGANILLHNEV